MSPGNRPLGSVAEPQGLWGLSREQLAPHPAAPTGVPLARRAAPLSRCRSVPPANLKPVVVEDLSLQKLTSQPFALGAVTVGVWCTAAAVSCAALPEAPTTGAPALR